MSLLLPAYLLGLIGLALPWLLHRFSDHNPPEEVFPSRRFLEATTPPVSRKRTLRYRLLLLLRVLALGLLCLLFAQPWLQQDDQRIGRDQHHIIALDQSLSMRAAGRWDDALDKARQLLAELSGSNSVEIISFDGQVNRLGNNQSQEGNLENALRDLQPGYSTTDYGALMTQVNRLAAEQELPAKLWLISDRQRSALPAQLNALYAPDLHAFEMHSVLQDEAQNVYLSAVADVTDDVNLTITTSVQYTATSDNAPEIIERTVAVEFREDTLASQSVQLRRNQLETVVFDDLELPARSNPFFEVRLLQDDALSEDDRVVLPVQQAIPTQIVLLRGVNQPADDASVFVRTALETDALAAVQTVRGRADQAPADAAHLITGRPVVDEVDLDVRQFVDAGRNALVFNSDQRSRRDSALIDASDNSTDDKGSQQQGSSLFSGAGTGELNEAHPLSLGDIDWSGVEFFDLPEFELQDEDNILLLTQERHVVLVERPTNRGRLLILNDPLDGIASNLPLQPAFVALMQSIIEYFDASTSIPTVVTVGTRVALPANTQVIDPQEQPLLSPSDRATASTVNIRAPGVYTVLGSQGERQLLAILDRNEADLSVLSQATIDGWTARFEQQTSEETVSGTASERSQQSMKSIADQLRESLWRWIFPLLMAVVLLETMYANRRLDVRRDGS